MTTLLTRQEVFDKAATHLLTQNKQSISVLGDCVLRNEEGLMCALGCLIDPEFYQGFRLTISWLNAARASGIDYTNDEKFFIDLRLIHDVFKPQDWKDQLIQFGNIYNLNTTVLDRFS